MIEHIWCSIRLCDLFSVENRTKIWWIHKEFVCVFWKTVLSTRKNEPTIKINKNAGFGFFYFQSIFFCTTHNDSVENCWFIINQSWKLSHEHKSIEIVFNAFKDHSHNNLIWLRFSRLPPLLIAKSVWEIWVMINDNWSQNQPALRKTKIKCINIAAVKSRI